MARAAISLLLVGCTLVAASVVAPGAALRDAGVGAVDPSTTEEASASSALPAVPPPAPPLHVPPDRVAPRPPDQAISDAPAPRGADRRCRASLPRARLDRADDP